MFPAPPRPAMDYANQDFGWILGRCPNQNEGLDSLRLAEIFRSNEHYTDFCEEKQKP